MGKKDEQRKKKNQCKVTEENNRENKKPNKVLSFLMTSLNGMAYGLFATLIVGTIVETLATYLLNFDVEWIISIKKIFINASSAIKFITGAGIGAGIALALKYDLLKTIVLSAVGQIAGYMSLSAKNISFFAPGASGVGDPLTIYLVVIAVALLMKVILVKKTPVDILIVPLLGVILGIIVTMLVRVPSIYVTYGIQTIIDKATLAVPFVMGVIVAVVMGMALTAPISSAAIAAVVFTGEGLGLELASGAAVIGCCTQMIGFAIQSRKDNNIGMVISIAIGTSMLQFKNILKKPIIWLPTIIASAILGPVSTCWLKLKCMGSGNNSGMGTAGFVGVIGTFNSMGYTWLNALIIILMEIVIPGLLVFGIDLLFRKFNLIKDGDLKVNN
jgi:uncharacterized membrane protein